MCELEEYKVGIAEYKITEAPNSLITVGLGSCVGIALYDKKQKKGSLLHIMLPDSTGFRDTTKWEKFADLAIPKVVEEMSGSDSSNIVAKIAGGASLFNFTSQNKSLQIGKRNIEMVRKQLEDLGIPILGEHLGGDSGRTMKVDLESFDVSVRLVNREIYHI